MKHLNLDFAIGVGYICFWIGVVSYDVGIPPRTATPTQWYHVLLIAGILIIPFIAGFSAGRHYAQVGKEGR